MANQKTATANSGGNGGLTAQGLQAYRNQYPIVQSPQAAMHPYYSQQPYAPPGISETVDVYPYNIPAGQIPQPQQLPLYVNYAQAHLPFSTNHNQVMIPRVPSYWDAWKLHPDNKYRIANVPGVILSSLFMHPKESLLCIILGGLGLFACANLFQSFWNGQLTISGPGTRGQAIPEFVDLLPEVDYQP